MIDRRARISRPARSLLSLLLIFLGWVGLGNCEPPLKVGALIPYTGRWGEAGREHARGMADAGRWINHHGGIYGRKLEILSINDTFQFPETIAAFRKLNEADHVPVLHVYATETALGLLSHIQSARVPTFVSFLPSPLANPAKYPFLFSIVPTPLDLSKIAMTFISEKGGVKVRKPKIVFLGSPDYLDRHFLEGAKAHARTVGLEVGPDVLFADLASSQVTTSADKTRTIPFLLEGITRYNPDFVYLSLTSREASSFLQEAHGQGMKIKWIANMKAFDETLAPFDGVLGVQPLSPFGADVPGMGEIKEAHQRWHPYDTHTLWYTEGWAITRVMAEVLGRSLPEERLSREKVKESIENLRNFVTGGLTPPITITRSDHRPSVESRILVIRDRTLVPYTPFLSIGREGGLQE